MGSFNNDLHGNDIQLIGGLSKKPSESEYEDSLKQTFNTQMHATHCRNGTVPQTASNKLNIQIPRQAGYLYNSGNVTSQCHTGGVFQDYDVYIGGASFSQDGGRVATQKSSAPPKASSVSRGVSAKRPSNSWILYRQEHHAKVLSENPGLSNNQISKVIAEKWSCETFEVKEKYRLRSQKERERHKLLYPDYKYAPRKNKTRRGRLATKKNTLVQDATKVTGRKSPISDSGQQKLYPEQIAELWTQVGMQPMSAQPYQLQMGDQCADEYTDQKTIFDSYPTPGAEQRKQVHVMTPHPKIQGHEPDYFYDPRQMHLHNSVGNMNNFNKSYATPRYSQGGILESPVSACPGISLQNYKGYHMFPQEMGVQKHDVLHACQQQPMEEKYRDQQYMPE